MNKPQPGLTQEVYALLFQNHALLDSPKQVWSKEEMQIIYKIYNAYTGEQASDSGCGGCRSSKVNKVRKIYEEYKSTL